MPIEGRSPKDCFDQFKDFVGPLVSKVLPTKMPIGLEGGATEAIAFLRFKGDALTVPITTRLGPAHFYLRQQLEATKVGRREYRLSTRRYWYRVQLEPGFAEAVVRWEYVSKEDPEYRDKKRRWCTHHVQMGGELGFSDGNLNLNDAHLPTGWVTLEEVFRFLIDDLGVAPPCGDEWDGLLRAAEKRFFTDFTSKRY